MKIIAQTIYETFSEKETADLGRRFGETASPGDVYVLNGDLGAGKTAFAKGVAEGLGIMEPVSSPTFTIIQSYEEGRIPLYHFDVYRILDPQEMEEIGYEDCFYGDGLAMVEWGSRILGLLPKRRREISIETDIEKGFDYRRITVSEVGI